MLCLGMGKNSEYVLVRPERDKGQEAARLLRLGTCKLVLKFGKQDIQRRLAVLL